MRTSTRIVLVVVLLAGYVRVVPSVRTFIRDWRTRVHKDKGDLPEGVGVMSVVRAGDYDGCFLVFPKFRVAVDMRTTDVLLADVHEWHGNTPFIGTPGSYDRISTVFYYRSKMRECGTPEAEIKQLKHRPFG